ncbi:MAG: phenylalanine--tRNA ligase subunit beta [Chloroflexi bacterium]|nr:phenylalanine--tRNA ligase subunit beta [Chloroflexota bacterium]MDA1228835.1 phenylalanine--tRNA ligase subunit beta [Chloroflexota bacterium]
MKVPISWLKKYVPVDMPAKELAHRLTMAGNEVGEVDVIGGSWDPDKVVIGHVLKIEPHPNADRLRLPTVDIGNGETATVVCGAPNVAEGQKIAFAKEGALLFSPRTGGVEELKAAKIRGVESSGMVCSTLELGMGEDHSGILVLDDAAVVGTPLVDLLGDAVLDVEVTPNRPDCLSILGIAHEVAALTGATVTEPDISYEEVGEAIDGQASVEIEDPELCGRYTATLIKDIKIGDSPRWMQEALIRSGQRPINNIVDITNYVMLEYGQPLHAFDFGKVKESKIIVRAARPGEKHVTLDGENRNLEPPMLVIADVSDAVGMAGVMGGANTEIDETTRTVFLESANFSATNTRRTRNALGVNTEASYRFERGIRAELAPLALRRATRLIVELAGGKAAPGIIDIYPGEKPAPVVKISRQRIRQMLGVDYSLAKIEEVLTSLGFKLGKPPEGLLDMMESFAGEALPERQESLWVEAPYWRSDINIEEDVIEELARIIGYDSIPTSMLAVPIPHNAPNPAREMRERIKDLLAAAGMYEATSYSLVNTDMLSKVNALDAHKPPIKISNPISADFEYLRTSLRGSMLTTLAYNRRISQGEGIRLFEVGKVFLASEDAKERDLPDERETLIGVLSGPRFPTSWTAPQGELGFFDAKGILEGLFRSVGAQVDFEGFSEDAVLEPGKTAQLLCNGSPVGVIGQVSPDVLRRFDLDGSTVAMFEVDLASLRLASTSLERKYQGTSRYPESYRDLALIVDANTTSAQIEAIINRHKLVVRSLPFDVYSGDGVPEGKKSAAFRLVFQSDKETLTSEQVDKFQSDILRQLQRELSAELRG